jgi:hypothetical protein
MKPLSNIVSVNSDNFSKKKALSPDKAFFIQADLTIGDLKAAVVNQTHLDNRTE